MTNETSDVPVDWQRHWQIDPQTTYLNHGAFGGTPKRVLNEQDELRRRMEENPVKFFGRDLPGLVDRARAELAEFLGADPEGLVFTRNATDGINAVLRSREFDPGDELLVTSHGYRSCQNALEFVAERSGASIVVADIPFPTAGADEIVDSILEAVTPKTELALIDHVTSRSGIVMPVAELIDELDDRPVDTLIDGAHAAGMVDVEIEQLAPTYYAGNCHKWMCAPKGAGYLWVEDYERDDVHPTSIGHSYRESFDERSTYHAEFDWIATDDPTPWLCVPEAIDYLGSLLPGGWSALRDRNQRLAGETQDILCDTLGLEAPVPEDRLGTLVTVPLPDRPADLDDDEPDPLNRALLREHGFEVPVFPWPESPNRILRVSTHLYNYREQVERLADVLDEILGGE